MKKHVWLISGLAILKGLIHGLGNRHYGFHRDELLHLSVSEHLDWGYMEFPPFIAFVGKVFSLLFDYSLLGTRISPTLAGIGILIICCFMAKEIGGKTYSILLAGVCTLAFLPYYRNHTLFQPVAFDQLFWTLGYYIYLKFINTRNNTYLLGMGIIAGVGLMNKYTMMMWCLGVALSLLFLDGRKIWKNKFLYLSALISLIILSPNIIWQFQHNTPFLLHLTALREDHFSEVSPWSFATMQLNYPYTFLISSIGLGSLLLKKDWRPYRVLALAVLITFFAMWYLQSKFYYLFSIYPILFASGSVAIENLLDKRAYLIVPLALGIFLAIVPYIPTSTPILPIETYVNYYNQPLENGRVILTGDYADMFGWEEQVAIVDSVYQSLAQADKAQCVIWAENYGEAGAIKILGKRYGLPNPISSHGSFWLWGYANDQASVWIGVGLELPFVERIFEKVEIVKYIHHPYAIEEEQGIPITLCRKPKVNIARWWAAYEEHVFD